MIDRPRKRFREMKHSGPVATWQDIIGARLYRYYNNGSVTLYTKTEIAREEERYQTVDANERSDVHG